MKQLESGSFSRFAVELVCFDLRTRRAHSITGPLAKEPTEVQDAVDRTIVAQFPQRTSGDTIRALIQEAAFTATERTTSAGAALVKERQKILVPALLVDIIDVRWRELHFRGLSDYVTSLIRYDLLLGGPHKFFRGDDCTPEMLEALDRETLAALHAHANAESRPRILADYLVEEALGQKLTRAEREAVLGQAGKQLVRAAAGPRRHSSSSSLPT
jgi:hypothetical protein